jgi:hypothetical protein
MVIEVDLIVYGSRQVSQSLGLYGRRPAATVRNTVACRVIALLVEMLLPDDVDFHSTNENGTVDRCFPFNYKGS